MKRRTSGAKPLTETEISFIQKLVDEGWPKRQIRYTYGVSNYLMAKHFPNYKGMGFKEAGSIGRAIGRTRMRKDLVVTGVCK